MHYWGCLMGPRGKQPDPRPSPTAQELSVPTESHCLFMLWGWALCSVGTAPALSGDSCMKITF